MVTEDQIFELRPLVRRLDRAAKDHLSLAIETNSKGFQGFIVELPGAYVRGRTLEESVSKTRTEAGTFFNWLGKERITFPTPQIVQTLQTSLMVEDADCEILLADDTRPTTKQEFGDLVQLANYSGRTFNQLYQSAGHKDWIDEARIRRTFYGPNKKTIQEIFDHVKRTQYYYISRTGVAYKEEEKESFDTIRWSCLRSLTGLFRENGNTRVYDTDGEKWTLKKVLRRFIWHDRIHAKAIVRILEKQRRLQLIDSYKDPFTFKLGSATN